MIKPAYTHDCDECIFLGRDRIDMVEVDVYFCKQFGSPTIVLRFSSEPSEYTSWNFIFMKESLSVHVSPAYKLAYKYYEQAKKAIDYKE